MGAGSPALDAHRSRSRLAGWIEQDREAPTPSVTALPSIAIAIYTFRRKQASSERGKVICLQTRRALAIATAPSKSGLSCHLLRGSPTQSCTTCRST